MNLEHVIHCAFNQPQCLIWNPDDSFAISLRALWEEDDRSALDVLRLSQLLEAGVELIGRTLLRESDAHRTEHHFEFAECPKTTLASFLIDVHRDEQRRISFHQVNVLNHARLIAQQNV